MVLLLLLLIISVFGGSIRYTSQAAVHQSASSRVPPPVFGLYGANGRAEGFEEVAGPPKNERPETYTELPSDPIVEEESRKPEAFTEQVQEQEQKQGTADVGIEPFHGGEFATY